MGETDILRIVSIVEGRCYVDGSIWLAVGVITLVIALLIQSVTKDALDRINAMVDTLPGAHDVRRLLEDMKETGDESSAMSPRTLTWHGLCPLLNCL